MELSENNKMFCDEIRVQHGASIPLINYINVKTGNIVRFCFGIRIKLLIILIQAMNIHTLWFCATFSWEKKSC